MKQIFLVLFSIPFFCLAQTGKTATEGYTISGSIKGYADGTSVSFFNEQTGGVEKKASFKDGKFVIEGVMAQPGFIGLIIADEQPMVPLFIENSKIKITGEKGALDKLSITGSPTHNLFSHYTTAIKPYEKLFSAEPDYDPAAIKEVVKISEDLVNKNPKSFVAPLAVLRLLQASEDGLKAEKLFNTLSDDVKASPLANYTAQQIAESKINPIGSVIQDFSQEDTAGNAVSISSLRGKYVLVDFWASWCRPCRMENPNVVAAFNKYKHKNFTVLGISFDQAKPAWLSAIKMDNLTWTQLSDLKGWGNAAAGLFKIQGIPQNFLIDPQGKIIAKNLRGAVLDKKLSALIP